MHGLCECLCVHVCVCEHAGDAVHCVCVLPTCLHVRTMIARTPLYPNSPLLSSPFRALMDCNGETPRLAFGHLDQDGCLEEDALTVDVVAGVSGDKLCSVTLTEQNPVLQHLKTRIAEALEVPVSDQVLLLANGQRLGAKRRLRSVLPDRSAVALVVSRPSCVRCGIRDGLWGRRAKLIQCSHYLEVYYCSRDCQAADAESHLRCGRP